MRLGKLQLPEAPSDYLPPLLASLAITPLSITVEHTLQTYRLPLHHRDPFDRIMIAQSQLEQLPLITRCASIKEWRDLPV
jgi:PIN domain nuclease of toxin-antitoxin system